MRPRSRSRRLKSRIFTDENDVGILTEKRSQARLQNSVRSAHLYLIDAGEVELDRVLGRHNVGFRRVQCLECRIQGIRLTRTVGPVTSTIPYGLEHRPFELIEALLLETKLGHVEHQLVFVQQAEYDLFTEQRRQTRYTKIQLS